jgi:uncharacterized protein (TIGR03067 family)
MRCHTLIALCLSCQVGAALHAQGDADKGSKELQGEWRAVELQTGGKPAPKEVVEKARLEVKGDEMTWNSGGTSVRKSRIRLDPSKSPKKIDITALDGPGKGTTYPGIYALEKGQLRLCYSRTKDRPKEFKTERGELRDLVILERVKPK